MRHSLPGNPTSENDRRSENITRSQSNLNTSQAHDSENNYSRRSTLALTSAPSNIPTIRDNVNVPVLVDTRLPNYENLIAFSRLSTISADNPSNRISTISNDHRARTNTSVNESLFDFNDLSIQEQEDIADEIDSDLNPQASNFFPLNVNQNVTVAFEDSVFRDDHEERRYNASVHRANATLGQLNNMTYAISDNHLNRRSDVVSEVPNVVKSTRRNQVLYRDVITNRDIEPTSGQDARVNTRQIHSNISNHHHLDFPQSNRAQFSGRNLSFHNYRDDAHVEGIESGRNFGEGYDNVELRNNFDGIDSRGHSNRFPNHNYEHRPRPRTNILNRRPANGDEEYPNNRFVNRRGVPVNKWRIFFSGNGRGWELLDFLSQVTMYQRAELVSNEELLYSVIHLLNGRARLWYQSVYDSIETWDELVIALKEEFLPEQYDYALLYEIGNRKQKLNESFSEYIVQMKSLFKWMDMPISDRYKAYLIRRNLLARYTTAIAPLHIESLAQLSEACRRIDNAMLPLNRVTQPLPFQ